MQFFGYNDIAMKRTSMSWDILLFIIEQYIWSLYIYTWWLITLSKWVITPVINGISRVNPLITGVITYLLSVMSHQVYTYIYIYIIIYIYIYYRYPPSSVELHPPERKKFTCQRIPPFCTAKTLAMSPTVMKHGKSVSPLFQLPMG